MESTGREGGGGAEVDHCGRRKRERREAAAEVAVRKRESRRLRAET